MFFKELNKLFFYVQNNPDAEKYTFKSLDPNIHYTIRFWSRNKTIELHKKNELTSEYYKYFEISIFKFLLFVKRLERYQQYHTLEFFLKKKINIGKLKKYKCVLYPLNQHADANPKILKITRKGRQIRINKNFDFNSFMQNVQFIEPDEINNYNEEVFFVYRYKKGQWLYQGFIYKLPQIKSLYFVSKRDFNNYSKTLMVAAFNLAIKIDFENKNELLKKFYDYITKNLSSIYLL